MMKFVVLICTKKPDLKIKIILSLVGEKLAFLKIRPANLKCSLKQELEVKKFYFSKLTREDFGREGRSIKEAKSLII